MVCKLSPQTLILSLDDKYSVPLGEPDLPQSTQVRAQNRSLGLVETSNVSLDHDFYVAGVVPSVCVLVDIPENNRDSLPNGIIHVTMKDKVFSHLVLQGTQWKQ